ncbi:MAG: hypothetical protein N2323_04715 [candidate division WOR-3 bacterium]|nr:hypothetical protein [candidate division WOR-3 bacterium]
MKKVIFIFLLILGIIFSQEWRAMYPSARYYSRMIVDTLNHRIILFGGMHRWYEKYYKDVWEIPLGDTTRYFWIPVKVGGNPITGRANHLLVYVPTQQRAIVFGGEDYWGSRLNDVWSLDLTLGQERWERLYPTGTQPMGRVGTHGIYHPIRNSVILFGGLINSHQVNDVWELDFDTLKWQQIFPTGEIPARRSDHCAIFDEENNRMIIFAGSGDGNFYNDLWALNLTPGQERWERLNQTGDIPYERCGFAYGYDPIEKKLYIFGGWNYQIGVYFNDVYVLDLRTLNWRRIYPQGEIPEQRRNSCGVFDFYNKRFIIFGGDYHGCHSNDTYILDISQSGIYEWKRINIISKPQIFVLSLTTNLVKIRYILPNLENMKIEIFDNNGRLVRTIFSGIPTSYTGWLTWDKKDNNQKEVSSGIYYCRLTVSDFSCTQKIVLIND